MPTAFNNSPIREHSNEIDRYYDHDINAGGPIVKDKIWFFGTYRQQFNAVAQPNFQFDKTFDTLLWNAVGKATYQVNQKNKLIGYYQWGQKEQPNRLPFATYTYASPEQTLAQVSGSWVYKAEWNGTVSDKLYLEARYGDFGYYFPLSTNSPDNFFWHDTGRLVSEGAHQKQQLDRDRKQYTGAATYFLDTAKGSHTFKFGAELLKEQSWEGFESRRGGTSDIEQIYSNGVSTQVIFGLPTATCAVGTLAAHDCLTSQRGARSDRRVRDRHLGDWQDDGQRRRPLRHVQGLAPGAGADWRRAPVPRSVAAKTFAETDLFTWNVFAPRIGVVYDLTGDGKTVLKANYGLYWHNPGAGLGGSGNPNIASKSATYAWNDINGDKRWQSGEEGALQSASLEGAIRVDPEHQGALHARSQLLDRTPADRHHGPARRLRLQDRRRPVLDHAAAARHGAVRRRLHGAVHLRRHRCRRHPRHRRRQNLTLLGLPDGQRGAVPGDPGRHDDA